MDNPTERMVDALDLIAAELGGFGCSRNTSSGRT